MASRPLSRHLADLCAENAGRDPAGLAVICGDTRLTFAELDRLVDRVAAALHGFGVRRGSTIGLLCTNRWKWIAAAIGAMRLGARVAAFNTFVKAWDLGHMIEHSGAEILITLDRFRSSDYLAVLAELGLDRTRGAEPMGARLRETFVIGEPASGTAQRLFAELVEEREPPPPAPTSAADVGFLLYTSGSSSRPKAVPLQHYGLVENGFQIGERMELTAADRVWVPVPLFWAYGACNALSATLSHGATLVLQEAFEPEQALDLLAEHRCTAAYLLPNIARALLDHGGSRPAQAATLRTGLTLGTPSEVRTIAEDLGVERICNIYGQTETYGNCCVTPASWPLQRRCAGQGPPLPGVELAIRDQSGEEVAANEVGQIHVRGYVTPGYAGDAAASAKAIDADGWFASGDLGSLDEDGCLHFSARDTEMIKTGGINVAPLEVEEFLLTHPDVLEATVIGAADERAAEVVVAFAVAQPTLSAERLRSWCGEHLAAYKVPARIHLVEQLDRTDTGKVSRRLLLERDKTLTRYGERAR
jgi:fatty-acyl-CoA synthase